MKGIFDCTLKIEEKSAFGCTLKSDNNFTIFKRFIVLNTQLKKQANCRIVIKHNIQTI